MKKSVISMKTNYLRQLLTLWPNWREYFDTSNPQREPQLILKKFSEQETKLLDLLRLELNGISYLYTQIGSAEDDLNHERLMARIAEENAMKARRQQEETDRQLQEAAEKLALLAKLIHRDLEEDYIKASSQSPSYYADWLTQHGFWDIRKKFVRNWLEQKEGFLSERGFSIPDDEQIAAIAAVEGNVRVIARAGSGKTSTLILRFWFLQEHCRVQPSEMLLLAFNKKAADTMRAKFDQLSPDCRPHIMTFHALAYAIVQPEKGILMDDPEEDGEKNKSRYIQTLTNKLIQQPEYYSRIRDVMLSFFRQDWEDIISGHYEQPPASLIEWRRNIPRLGIDGNDYKSKGEKRIADFLFEHEVPYEYEKHFWFKGINYRPDFTLPSPDGKSGLIIEYFGLDGDSDYDEMSNQKKAYWEEREGWQLISLTPRDFQGKSRNECYKFLKNLLFDYKINASQISIEQLWKKIQNQQPLNRFTAVASEFIQRCRKKNWDILQLDKQIEKLHKSPIENSWLTLARDIYKVYLDALVESGQEDFDGLLFKASTALNSGKKKFKRKNESGDLSHPRFIAVDEYQDFSELFHCLLGAIRNQAPQARVFCVGDDWQAINRFAGAELRFFESFNTYFPEAIDCPIATNYRSLPKIVDLANQLMAGKGIPAKAEKTGQASIQLVDLNAFQITERENSTYNHSPISAAIVRIVNQLLLRGKDVALLARTNFLPESVADQSKNSRNLDVFLDWLRHQFPATERKRITISTTHRYKGREKPAVILLDVIAKKYPLIHPDSQFTRLFGDTLDAIVAEEMRLLYVALTRPEQELFILTRADQESPFLGSLRPYLKDINWSDYPPIPGTIQRIVVRIKDAFPFPPVGTHRLKDNFKANYSWVSESKCWWTSFPVAGFSTEAWLKNADWLSKADGICIEFYDDHDKPLAVYDVINGMPRVKFDKFAEALVSEEN